jgi:GNAT superfamily N-acetyltransferase
MEIRDARPAEFDEIRGVMVAGYSEYAAWAGDELWQEWSAEIADLESRLGESRLIVATAGGAILGAVTYYPPGTGGGYDESWPRPWAGFRMLAVAPAARGRGAGRALVDASIDAARADGASVLSLGTTEVMKVGRELYERMGFVRAPGYDFYPAPGILVYAYTLALEAT